MLVPSDFLPLLHTPKRMVITTHVNPDGDAIGSSLGLYHFLKQLGHEVRVIVPNFVPEAFIWLTEADKILIFDRQTDVCSQLIAEADMIFSLDYNDLKRVELMGEWIGKSSAYKVMIDHHLYPDNFAALCISDTTASSTAELVYEFIVASGGTSKMNKDVIEALYCGLLTDTGSFRYSTSAKLFHIVASLIDKGLDDIRVSDLILNSSTESRLRLLGFCLTERMEILDDFNTGIIYLSKEDFIRWNADYTDLEGVVNYVLRIKHIRLAAFITEREGEVKISLRSKGKFSVQEMAAKHFNGGGHRNASGGKSALDLASSVAFFKSLLPYYREQLLSAI